MKQLEKQQQQQQQQQKHWLNIYINKNITGDFFGHSRPLLLCIPTAHAIHYASACYIIHQVHSPSKKLHKL